MAMPTVTVEIGFDVAGVRQGVQTVYSSLSWTNVTAYVRAKEGVTFQRGRAEAGQSASAGQLTVSFDNTDGRFTPGVTGGAYGPVRTRMPIRVKADSTVLWLGFVTDIDWKIEAGHPVVSMSASDIIATAARTKCGPWMTKRVLAKSAGLIHYWPLTDTAPNSLSNNTNTAVPTYVGETLRPAAGANYLTVASRAGVGDLSVNVTSDLSTETIEPVAAFTPTGAGGKILTGATVPLDSTGDLAVSMWVRPTGYAYSRGLFASYLGSSGVMVYTTSDGYIQMTYGQSYLGRGDGWSIYFAPSGLTPDTWSHLYFEVDNSQTSGVLKFRMWRDGTELTGINITGGSWTPYIGSLSSNISIGGNDWVPSYATQIDPWNGQMGHVAIWNTLDSTRAAFLANNGGAGATPCDTRMGELQYVTTNPAGLSSWITADTAADNTVSPQTVNAKSLLQVAEEVADAERGSIIATRLGKLHLLAQRYFVAPAAASVELSAENDVMQLGNAFGVDDSANLNECVVTLQPSGWRYTATRAVEPGVESTTLDIWSGDQFFAEALALQIANADTERPRAPSLTLSVEWLDKVGLADEVLGLELGDTIRVTDLPSQAPGSELTLQVRAIGHTITTAGWLVNIDTDPPVLGAITDDTDRGLLGDTTYLGV